MSKTLQIISLPLILVLAFIFLFPILIPTASAENTFTCSYRTGGGTGEEKCLVSEETCKENYIPSCQGNNEAECLVSAGTCVPAKKIPIAEQVASFYQWAVGISALVALGILVYAGLAYTVAGGNASRQNDAKQWIWNALIGLALLFGSYLILNTINPNLTKLQNIDLSQVQVEVAKAPQAAKNLNLPELIGNFYQWALGIGGIIALGIIIFGGILYTISPGNSSRQGDAKTWLGSAIVGLVLLFGSYAILNTVNPDLTKLKFNLDKVEFSAPASSPTAPLEPPKPGEKVPLGIAQQIGNFYQWALGIGGLVALGVLIFGGILYIISAGNASRQEDAKGWLLGAVMGILLLFGSYLILNTISPELTKLKDLELIVNKAAQFSPTEPRVYTPPFSGPDCGGVYIIGSETANKGNFGDPSCEAQAGANPQYRQELATLLRSQDPSNALHWYKTVIPCESGYNPNAFNPNAPQGAGGWGLFQMGSVGRVNPRYDFGNVPWRNQVSNAVNLLRENRSGYWECW